MTELSCISNCTMYVVVDATASAYLMTGFLASPSAQRDYKYRIVFVVSTGAIMTGTGLCSGRSSSVRTSPSAYLGGGNAMADRTAWITRMNMNIVVCTNCSPSFPCLFLFFFLFISWVVWHVENHVSLSVSCPTLRLTCCLWQKLQHLFLHGDCIIEIFQTFRDDLLGFTFSFKFLWAKFKVTVTLQW